MTLPEQAGKVATTTIEAMKNSPGLLAVILLQLGTLGLLYFVTEANNQRRQERELMMLDRCLDRTDAILKELKP
jgi:hypothetical protein